MDPYRVLGISRWCGREAVKAAFRARVWQAHPDRGGDADDFIAICAAYKQILEELERRPEPAASGPARGARPARPGAPPDAPGSVEFILLGDPPSWSRPPAPPDPDWEPDLVLGDQDDPGVGRAEPVVPRVAKGTYVSWMREVGIATRRRRRRSIRRSAWFRAVGIVILLTLLGGNLWLCWVAWSYDSKRAELEAQGAAVGRLDGEAGDER
jgi:hypothetical protein